jgi:iron(III) transport system substrate-binding protein
VRRIALLAVLVLAACSKPPPPPAIVVFAAGEPGGWLEAVLDDYSSATGTPLDVRWGNSTELADALIRKSGDSADVLITDGVADIWRAGDRGALRPIGSAAFESQASWLKDPDGYWAALASYSWAVVYGGAGPTPTLDLDDLASSPLQDRLCLVSSRDPAYRALLSHLIAERGIRAAERLVRLWRHNLAAPPYESEDALLDAVANAGCTYGVVRLRAEDNGAHPPLLDARYIDVAAIGIGRHAQNAEGAQELVDWVLRNNEVAVFDAAEFRPASLAGWHDEEAQRLAERAGYL